MAGLVENGSRHAGQSCYLDAIAAAGGAGLNGVQEDDIAPRFSCADMDIDRAVVGCRKFCEFKVMGGKQRKGLGFVMQLGGDGAGQGKAIKRGGSTPNFIHQNQRLRCCAVQYLRGFDHFQHEGGLGIGQIVCSADAGVNRINRPQTAAARGNVGAYAGEQDDDRDLAHIGGFTAHVRAGDDLHSLLGTQTGVIGDEIAAAELTQAGLNHGVASLVNVNARLIHKLGHAPAKGERPFGQSAQGVKRCQRPRQAGERRNKNLQLLQDIFKQPFFTR